jgi:hypothetical protein
VASNHHWAFVGTHRQRCTECKTIRSEDGDGSEAWSYCAPGEPPATRDPGCYQRLPDAPGAAFVDGER